MLQCKQSRYRLAWEIVDDALYDCKLTTNWHWHVFKEVCLFNPALCFSNAKLYSPFLLSSCNFCYFLVIILQCVAIDYYKILGVFKSWYKMSLPLPKSIYVCLFHFFIFIHDFLFASLFSNHSKKQIKTKYQSIYYLDKIF